MLMSTQNVVLGLAALLGQVAADLPVHCLRHQIEGDWDFHLSPVSDKRSSCGHLHPDTEDGQPARSVQLLGAKTTAKRVTLLHPNVAKSKEDVRGTWTMVYDEGFEVNVDGFNFFAFSNFTFEKDPKTSAKHNVSHCGDTMVGWYQSVDRTKFGCYYGNKLEKAAPVPLPQKDAMNKSVHYDKAIDKKAMVQKVAKLNKKLAMLQLGWKARVVPKFIGKTMRQINNYAGIKRAVSMREFSKDLLSQQQSKPRSFLQVKPVKLPESYDWTNVSDGAFLEPVMDQGDCGSCYAASSMRMLSARHKVATKDTDALPWSINAPLFCGEYNQGCKGGYPFLMTRWSSDVGLVPATCMRYNTAGKCQLECDLDKLEGKRYRASSHRYVGSWYGNSTEKAIMEELVHKGPLVLSFEPADDFMFYSDGIYQSAGPAKKPLEESRPEWERVDHAVLLVGYGEEDGKKYWKLQNSWGEDWGEDGYFRMLRGVDESGIEGIAVAADVIEDEKNGKLMNEFFAQMNKKEL
eukprot:gnl/MRDRNA2_/MRDRNA2_63218_c0_seq2.p1 gnl/MRDRNA2_/MRDRNA2_63218_c0~~gnl/MRDRNA2_/MRDRNA2_63218_c0_seq2.p1  ORF type:complete len:518 (-),score=118.32 gnl/MRDRNA2_/MRDRNA2_63218_c0_seq2:7-1560(-)